MIIQNLYFLWLFIYHLSFSFSDLTSPAVIKLKHLLKKTVSYFLSFIVYLQYKYTKSSEDFVSF